MEKGQRCWLHKAGHESKVFINGSEEYDTAIDAGWTSERQLREVRKDDEQNNEGDLVDNSGSGTTLVAELNDEDLIDLFTTCIEEIVKRDLDTESPSAKDKEKLVKENTAGFGQVDLSNPETLNAQLKELDLFSLRTLCVELEIEGMEKANGATCIKYIKEYVNK